MSVLFFIFFSNFIISLGSLIGVFTLTLNQKFQKKVIFFLISLSAGSLIGGAFLHLLPEAQEKYKGENLFLIVLLSFIIFFLVEKLLFWRHCHKERCEIHTFGYMNLFGDGLHNFIDGLIIAGSFLTDIKLGIATSLAVALHELPQEIGDFGVLLYAGFEKNKAIIANFLVATASVIGGIVGYFISFSIEKLATYLLPFAAGGFIYIAASDLMPEIRKETNIRKSVISFSVFILGIGIMFLIKLIGYE